MVLDNNIMTTNEMQKNPRTHCAVMVDEDTHLVVNLGYPHKHIPQILCGRQLTENYLLVTRTLEQITCPSCSYTIKKIREED